MSYGVMSYGVMSSGFPLGSKVLFSQNSITTSLLNKTFITNFCKLLSFLTHNASWVSNFLLSPKL
jgi:hypothetical protein